MTTVLLTIQLLIAIGLVAVILLQRSEGGALGVGGGPGGMMSGRSAANILTRSTMILAGLFIANSIALAVVTGVNSAGERVYDRTATEVPVLAPEEDDEDVAPVPTDG